MKSIEQMQAELLSWSTFDPWSHPIVSILKEVPKHTYIYKDELLKKLSEVLNKKNEEELNFLLLVSEHDGLNLDYTKIFCLLLHENWHRCHEDIIMMLEEIKDPVSVTCIYETALTVPDYDEGRSLAKKCIWALGAIKTIEAREKLKMFSSSADLIISETANMELRHQIK